MMGITGVWQWVIVLAIVLLLFGAGKVPRLMGDMAKGVKAFKKGLKDEEEASTSSEQAKEIPQESSGQTANTSESASEKDAAGTGKTSG